MPDDTSFFIQDSAILNLSSLILFLNDQISTGWVEVNFVAVNYLFITGCCSMLISSGYPLTDLHPDPFLNP
ncbi:hypothetical protein OKW21_001843 [Catalinimonas alkaloidigena]|uniref:hypothetical protein n=1 Tax=Catalinimonas alkaloidigena TaxID=1075417 RepID=UPI0024064BFE|nr:hypothetical protein [Catalinimonas alkaloidigena]MDF9796580.1 hypothetical protein [Catalinimonas alkaloidigena]